MNHLLAFNRVANEGRQYFANRYGIDLARKNTGGRAKMYLKHNSNPKWELTLSCLRTFDNKIPNEASGTENGSFYSFVAQVYEFATGEEAEGKGVGLSHPVKKVVPLYREWKTAEDEFWMETTIPDAKWNQAEWVRKHHKRIKIEYKLNHGGTDIVPGRN